ncbi:MAG TPA: HAD hydrolase family protein [Thermoanaerobaculia bacterium]|nr:HAD hydrolase family protein [Thermoanaerobaculia bacterium]
MTSPRRKAPKIKALFFDVDGVLTDGRVYMDDEGRESKVFDTKDGHGIKMAIAAGLHVAWISGRMSKATEQRALELGVAECRQGVADKAKVYVELCRRWGIVPRETAALGDDEPDVPLLTVAGFSACPADAAPPARKAAQVVLKSAGGRGAVREFIEHILRYNKLVEKTRSRSPG